MPQIFRAGEYLVFFWSNEGEPLEPIHVHITSGTPSENSTKIWISRKGKCLLCNNRSRIPDRALHDLMDMIEARSQSIIDKWIGFHGEITFYC